ncbi:MAG: hypothetical protein ABI155_12950 [Paralcaligenes sp.]
MTESQVRVEVAEIASVPVFKQHTFTPGTEAVGGDAKTYGTHAKEHFDCCVKAIEHVKVSVN